MWRPLRDFDAPPVRRDSNLRATMAPARNMISDDMITGLLIALAVGAGFTALFFAAASGISLQYGNKPRAISTGWLAIGLLAAALVAGWG